MKEFTIDLHDGRGNQVYVLKIDQLAALEAAVKAEATRIIKGNFTQICSYCGEEMLPPNGWNELQAHIQICPQHPLKKANEQIAALTAERDRLREACGYRWRKLLTETEPKEVENEKNQTLQVPEERIEIEL